MTDTDFRRLSADVSSAGDLRAGAFEAAYYLAASTKRPIDLALACVNYARVKAEHLAAFEALAAAVDQ